MQVAHIKAIFFPNGENTLAPPKIGHVRLKDSRGKTQGIQTHKRDNLGELHIIALFMTEWLDYSKFYSHNSLLYMILKKYGMIKYLKQFSS